MKRITVGCLLVGSALALVGCESAELSAGGMRVQTIDAAANGCRLVGTLRDREGGGLRSFSENRAILDARLRNEAARLGGDALSVVEEARGDTEQGQGYFSAGVAGLTTPSVDCTNCVLVMARVFQCGLPAPTALPAPRIPEQCAPVAPPPAAPPEPAEPLEND